MADEAPVCPKCGNAMKPALLDGSLKLDGSFNLSGFYCPLCVKSNNADDTKERLLKVQVLSLPYLFLNFTYQ